MLTADPIRRAHAQPAKRREERSALPEAPPSRIQRVKPINGGKARHKMGDQSRTKTPYPAAHDILTQHHREPSKPKRHKKSARQGQETANHPESEISNEQRNASINPAPKRKDQMNRTTFNRHPSTQYGIIQNRKKGFRQ